MTADSTLKFGAESVLVLSNITIAGGKTFLGKKE